MHHEIMLLIASKQIYKAPIKTAETHRVLDIGTGTGIWAIDYAEENPNAEVIGMDLRFNTLCGTYCTSYSNQWQQPDSIKLVSFTDTTDISLCM